MPRLQRVLLIAPILLAACASTRTMHSQRADAELTREIEYRLAEDETASAFHVDVKVHRGVVTLLGEVETEAERAAAERIAGAVPGVIAVDDHLTVLNTEREAIVDGDNDVAITARISVEYAEDAVVRGRDIDVESVDGVVYLTGMVRTAAERRRAEDIAAGVEDVDKVVNLLTVGSEVEDERGDDLDDDRIAEPVVDEPEDD